MSCIVSDIGSLKTELQLLKQQRQLTADIITELRTFRQLNSSTGISDVALQSRVLRTVSNRIVDATGVLDGTEHTSSGNLQVPSAPHSAAVEDSDIAPVSVPDEVLHTTGGILRDARVSPRADGDSSLAAGGAAASAALRSTSGNCGLDVDESTDVADRNVLRQKMALTLLCTTNAGNSLTAGIDIKLWARTFQDLRDKIGKSSWVVAIATTPSKLCPEARTINPVYLCLDLTLRPLLMHCLSMCTQRLNKN